MTIRINTKPFRHQHGMSQRTLGDKVGVISNTVYCWERGRTLPDLRQLVRLADEFGCSLDELVVVDERAPTG